MEKVFVLQNKAYAAAVDAADISKIGDADKLQEGAIAIYSDKGTLIEGGDGLADVKSFQIAHNVQGLVRLTKSIDRRSIYRLINEDYVAPVMHKVIVGGTTPSTRLSIDADDVGHVGVRIADHTFSGKFAMASVNATVYKKSYMTPLQVVDKLVEKLNAATNIKLTAVRLDGDPGNYGISVESNTRGQVLTVTLSGLVEGNQIITDGSSASVLPVIGKGVAEDVLKEEKEASVYYGNGNYRELNESFYKAGFGTDANTNYGCITFQEKLEKPYLGEINVRPINMIYFPNDAQAVENSLMVILSALIGEAYAGANNAEPADDNDPGVPA